MTGFVSTEEWVERGRVARQAMSRKALAEHVIASDRPDPVALKYASDEGRDADLLPLKYERMGVSPLAFYRGFAAMHAYDLGQGQHSGLNVQLCGDMHLSNFGVYASPERNFVFDVNDFDETLPGPFEWDLKRLVTSFAVMGRTRGFSPAATSAAVRTVAEAYRRRITELAEMNYLSVWYDRMDQSTLETFAGSMAKKRVDKKFEAGLSKARGKSHARAAAKLTEVVDGKRRFRSDPPLLNPIDRTTAESGMLTQLFAGYLSTLSADRAQLLERYRMIDIARKVVGVGSVGTRCWVILLEGRGPEDLLVLQAKEAGPSVLEPYLRKSAYRHQGRRVVEGQRLTQAASDIFLGWVNGVDQSRQFYLRQLHDMKGGVDPDRMPATNVRPYAEICGVGLARAHARAGGATMIATYLGSGDKADRALAEYAEAYADQNDRDYTEFMAARAGS
ncbi:MAG: DUF2252 domain-containing protein [Actinomycetia bacterium]|nr:DUF2252 domain-containing protein [Actinomycetes bacterium]